MTKTYEIDEEKVLNLEKSRKGIQRIIYGRTIIIALLILLQVGILFLLSSVLSTYVEYGYGLYIFISAVIVMIVINRPKNPDINMSWSILILIVPVVGSILYIFVEMQVAHKVMNHRLQKIIADTNHFVQQDEATMKELEEENPGIAGLVRYMAKNGTFTANRAKKVKYFRSGEEKFTELINQLKEAKDFIFLEYFIIKEGYMWGRILKILKQKADEGVEVRVMYDGMCSLASLPFDYPKKIQSLGIQCKMFEPIHPILSTHYNNRDHRKILVIDGKVAFTGGINLADEYINRTHPYGYWKDTAVMVTGDAVKNFTLMFLQMWNLETRAELKRRTKEEDYRRYIDIERGEEDATEPETKKGYVIPYADSPLDTELVAETVFLDIINKAEKYVYIMTPYLVLDHELLSSICYAAKRDIKVIIVLPHIPDKKYAFALAQNQYEALLKAGVKIYEFTPGFVHAKICVADDRVATVGTINFDYRSLYLNFECGVLLYENSEIVEIRKDVEKTLEECEEKTLENYKKKRFWKRLQGKILKVFAPLI